MARRAAPKKLWTKFELYEAAVTDAPRLARFLAGVHGRGARTLREDFAGTGALARAWTQLGDQHHALAVDRDAKVLAHTPRMVRLRTIAADVQHCRVKADVIAATNFPVGYAHTRTALLTYLRHARRCLSPRGILCCDMYGGDGAFTPGIQTRRLRLSDGARLVYHWEQVAAHAATGMVENAIHFEVFRGNARVQHLRRAFVYHWRLWGIAELTDAMREAGFASVEVYNRLGDAIDSEGNLYTRPLSQDDVLDPTWVVYLVARASGASQRTKNLIRTQHRRA